MDFPGTTKLQALFRGWRTRQKVVREVREEFLQLFNQIESSEVTFLFSDSSSLQLPVYPTANVKVERKLETAQPKKLKSTAQLVVQDPIKMEEVSLAVCETVESMVSIVADGEAGGGDGLRFSEPRITSSSASESEMNILEKAERNKIVAGMIDNLFAEAFTNVDTKVGQDLKGHYQQTNTTLHQTGTNGGIASTTARNFEDIDVSHESILRSIRKAKERVSRQLQWTKIVAADRRSYLASIYTSSSCT